ncbi:MAG: ABC transporter permease [Planctomycetota bacterium]
MSVRRASFSQDITAGACLILRDMRHLIRRPGQIIGSLATPLLFWAMLAGGFADAIAPESLANTGAESFTTYLIPGSAMLVVVFAAMFSAMSLIEDRRTGVLALVTLSPRGSWVLPISKTAAGALIAWLQAMPILLLFPLFAAAPGASEAARASATWPAWPAWSALSAWIGPLTLAAGWLLVAATSASAAALALAAWCSTPRAFHGFINMLFMPGWLLSGAMFPIATASAWMSAAAAANPFAWFHRSISAPLVSGVSETSADGTVASAFLGLAACCVCMLIAMFSLTARRRAFARTEA